MPSAGHASAKSLSGKIFSSVSVFSVAVIVVFAVVLTTIFYVSYEKQAEEDLTALAQDAATCLNATSSETNIEALADQFDGAVRYTLIADDGVVLYDSVADIGGMENHADRPEFAAAMAAGSASALRHSNTVGLDTLYVAILLDDGSVLRLSETRHSLPAFLGDMTLPVVASLIVVVVLVFALSRIMTQRIMKPIDALDFSSPLDNRIYNEMRPLLERIDEQQHRLKQQNEELALAESMRRDFSSNVSHEMKTPLQVISGYAELMSNGMVPAEDQRRFAGLIYDEAQAMRSLIDDVLTLSRLDEVSFGKEASVIDVVAVAQRVVSRLGGFAESQNVSLGCVAVKTTDAEKKAFVAGSETLVEEMFYNLVENGIRYNCEGGRVDVEIQTEASPDAAEDRVIVRVSDTGPGIPPELREKVFERFYRIDLSRSKETGGTGLGLAIAKHAAMACGGSISIEDGRNGVGSTFVVVFPQCDSTALWEADAGE